MFAAQGCNIQPAKYLLQERNRMKMLSKIEMRTKLFAKKYVENNLNGTETAMQMYDVKNRNVARSIAGENLMKPAFNTAIQEQLELSGLNRTRRLSLLDRNSRQKKNYSASNQAIEIATKIAGDYAPERKESLSVSIDLTNQAQVENRLFEIQEELKKLQETHQDAPGEAIVP